MYCKISNEPKRKTVGMEHLRQIQDLKQEKPRKKENTWAQGRVEWSAFIQQHSLQILINKKSGNLL